jgi:hypothetical protein
MTQPKRICAIGAIVFLILLLTALAAHALVSPSVSSLAPVATRDQGLSQAWFFGQDTGAPHSPAMICALVIDAQIAQNEIPNVLVPSTIPSAEPSLPAASPTPQPPTVSTNSTNLIIALIPLLFVIGALFYFFFMSDQDRGAPSDENEANVQFTDAGEDTGWRELK